MPAKTPDPSDDPKARAAQRRAILGRAVGKQPPARPAPNHPKGWTKQSHNLPASHNWKTTPGYQTLVTNAGQFRFEFPQGWHNAMDKDALKLTDAPPPADQCRIQVTIYQTPGLTPSRFHELPLLPMAQEIFDKETLTDDEEQRRHAPEWKRLTPLELIDRYDGVQFAWCESSWLDEENTRTVLCRQFLLRASGFHALVTFDYYEDRAADFRPVWQHLVDSIRVNTPVNLLGDTLN